MARHPGTSVEARCHQRVRQESSRELVQVPAGRVPVHQGRAYPDREPTVTDVSHRFATVAAIAAATLLASYSEPAFAQKRRREPPPKVIPTQETQTAESAYR